MTTFGAMGPKGLKATVMQATTHMPTTAIKSWWEYPDGGGGGGGGGWSGHPTNCFTQLLVGRSPDTLALTLRRHGMVWFSAIVRRN